MNSKVTVMGDTANIGNIYGTSSSIIAAPPLVKPDDPKTEAVQSSLCYFYCSGLSIRYLLPPYTSSSLLVVIRVDVYCYVCSLYGAGIGSDPSQFERRYLDLSRWVRYGVPNNDDYATPRGGGGWHT